MFEIAAHILADFSAPMDLGTNPRSLLLLLPVVAAIAIVYKATKLPRITVGNFLKESVLLFGSIVVFMIITALVLSAVAWLITE
jgi:hypothetical protein